MKMPSRLRELTSPYSQHKNIFRPMICLHDALFAQIFTSGPAHYPPIPADLSDFKSITLDQVKTFAKRAFRSANATFALAGNVDVSLMDAVTAGAPGNADSPIPSSLASPPVDKTINAAVTGEGLAWTGPPIADERASTALDFIADYLFRDQTGVVSKALDPTGDAYVNGQFITLHDPGVMLVTIGGSKPADVETKVLAAITSLANTARRYRLCSGARGIHFSSRHGFASADRAGR